MVAYNYEKFNEEQVREEEAKDFANEINAIYVGVRSNGNGIDDLLQRIGKKFLKKKILNQNMIQEDEDEYKVKKEMKREKECVLF